MKNQTPHDPGKLRRQAEERLIERQRGQSSEVGGQKLAEDTAQTLHELRVHQIELELQNEELRRAQTEIEAGRERYFDLYDLAPVGYCTLSDKGLILDANLTIANLLGTARGALVKTPISRFIVKEDQDIYYLHRKKLFETGEPQEYDLRLVKPDGTNFWAHLTATTAQAEDGTPVCRVVLSDITERKQAEEALRESEATISKKLHAILELDGDIETLNLADIIDSDELQTLMEDFHSITQIGGAILDISGRVLVGVAWTDICAKFHRVHLETANNCLQSDLTLASGVPVGTFKSYRCKNNMWDMVSPIEIGGKHLGNIYIGQFFYEDEPVDYELFKRQARQHGFDEMEYIAALDRVPRFKRETINSAITFYSKLAVMISSLSYSKIKLSRDIAERKQAETYREMGLEVLQILNEQGGLQESIQRVLAALKTWTGCDAVGLRLQEGEDFPYFAQDGFSKDFLLTENTLVERGKDGGLCRNKDGNVCLECTCGLVISGKTDPANPLFTKGGSCWTNDSFPLLDLPSAQDPRLHPRNNCIHQGYASVALIPVRTSDRIVGLIQLNDKRQGRFTLETIQVLEGIAAHIGSALMRKQAEEKLAASEGILRNIMESQLSGFWDWNLADNTEYLSPALKRMFGYEDHEMESSPEAWQRIIFPEDLPNVLKVFDRHVKSHGKEPFYNEIRYRHRDGSTVWVICAGRVIEWANDGTAIRMVGFHIDITERKQAEAAREELSAQLTQAQKMESVGRLAGGVAHDFNNQLMGIMGYADFCRDGIAADHPIREWLDEITHGAERSAHLTRQLLAFARKQTIAPKVLDLNAKVADMLTMLRQLIGEDIDLLWEPGAELWPVKLDPGQTDQVLANLCVNARDAICGVGKVTIETQNVTIDADYCEEHADAGSGSYVMLAVSDDGCGVEKETLAHIFEPFYTTKGDGEGTGLGLATVYGIVKQNVGFINVYSEPGKGTTFRIYLPRFVGEDAGQAESHQASRPVGGSETILLVEDEKSVLVTTARFLEQLGYTVLTAETPSAALRLAAEREGAIELLITDVVMPGMNGRDLAVKLTGEYPRMKSLFISGYTANVIAHRGILDDGIHFLAKPFTRDDIARKVYEILKGKQCSSKE